MTADWPHGDISDAELAERGLSPADCLDFAVNVDPRGPHPAVHRAFRHANIARYPDPHARDLRRALAARDHVEPDQILVGHGVTGILWALMRALAGRDRVLVPAHSFHEYTAAARASALTLDSVPRRPHDGFALPWPRIHDWLQTHPTGVLVLGSPDNPTGLALNYDRLVQVACDHPRAVVIVDEAFLRLSCQHSDVRRVVPTNVWRLRSLTKELGMPGLRVGYVVAAHDEISRLADHLPPWSVGAAALAAAEAGVSDPQIVTEVRDRMRRDVDTLRATLRRLAVDPLPTATVFTLVAVGDGRGLAEFLRGQGLLVRDCGSFGLPEYVRLCGRPSADVATLATAWRRWHERSHRPTHTRPE
ncbi:MAG: aminotransferase class I/II-fold pyridoxal phosphate-dependent enzyme [Myxococcales bacterium FL481]|nr:MAG: aminotransferase class I/II-fold pyridoxal phosphate-dependent enzyme [Myxococcales bacterium FL481]